MSGPRGAPATIRAGSGGGAQVRRRRASQLGREQRLTGDEGAIPSSRRSRSANRS